MTDIRVYCINKKIGKKDLHYDKDKYIKIFFEKFKEILCSHLFPHPNKYPLDLNSIHSMKIPTDAVNQLELTFLIKNMEIINLIKDLYKKTSFKFHINNIILKIIKNTKEWYIGDCMHKVTPPNSWPILKKKIELEP